MAGNNMTRIDRWCNNITDAIVVLGLLCLLLGALSCNTSHRATSKFYRAVKLDRTTTGKNCYDVYPTKDSVTTLIEYKEGKNTIDTFTQTEVQVFNDTVYIKEIKYITDTKHDTAYIRITTSKENTAKIDYYRDGWDKEKIAHAESEQRGDVWMWIALSAIGVLAVLGIWKIWKLYRKTSII